MSAKKFIAKLNYFNNNNNSRISIPPSVVTSEAVGAHHLLTSNFVLFGSWESSQFSRTTEQSHTNLNIIPSLIPLIFRPLWDIIQNSLKFTLSNSLLLIFIITFTTLH